jgi:hypothetical protein
MNDRNPRAMYRDAFRRPVDLVDLIIRGAELQPYDSEAANAIHYLLNNGWA